MARTIKKKPVSVSKTKPPAARSGVKAKDAQFTTTGLRLRKKRASRLTIADWVNAAIEILVTRSVEHVRVELIAVNLGATKGSFYWHFKDRAALLDAIIDEWKLRATTLVETWAKSGNADAQKQLERLLDARPADSHWRDLELAMRAWSRRSERVREAALEVDHMRLHYVQRLLGELGYEGEEAYVRSLVFYGATRTMDPYAKLSRPKRQHMLQQIIKLILAR